MAKQESHSDDANAKRADIKVEAGECAVLSPDSARFRSYYKQVRPRTIDEVRHVIGLSAEAAKAAAEQGCCRPTAGLTSIPDAEDLDSKDDEARFNARSLAYQAAAQYISSPNPKSLGHWTPVLDKFLDVTKSVINVAFLQDIEVADGATLTISANTHAIYARNVVVHRTGRIVCQGSVTFRINSLEGIRLRRIETEAIVSR